MHAPLLFLCALGFYFSLHYMMRKPTTGFLVTTVIHCKINKSVSDVSFINVLYQQVEEVL